MTIKQPIRVFYVIDKDEADREVTAIFIDIPATYEVDELTCYVHYGQHGRAGLSWVKQKTVAASKLEYASLHQELTGIYDEYELVVCSKIDKFARGNRKDYLKDIESNRLKRDDK